MSVCLFCPPSHMLNHLDWRLQVEEHISKIENSEFICFGGGGSHSVCAIPFIPWGLYFDDDYDLPHPAPSPPPPPPFLFMEIILPFVFFQV